VAYVLIINSGSSSVKFALFENGESLARILSGKFERIGLSGSRLRFREAPGNRTHERRICLRNSAATVPILLALLQSRLNGGRLSAIGHRVVHGGMRYRSPQPVDRAMLKELQRISPWDPEHMPAAIGLMKNFARAYRDIPQLACFDTAFHRDLPPVAALLPIPRRYFRRGVRRYGFHGLSYAYLLEELRRTAGSAAARGRVILAHLGNGASLAAVYRGRCIDTTMAFTPAAGLVMSTRSGDLDPGLAAYFSKTERMSPAQFHQLVNARAGLLGLSETSSDLRDLLACEAVDRRAAEAVAVFCYCARKWIGALTAALGGLDTLVFAGGIGENSAVIRSRICSGLGYLGVRLEPGANRRHAPVISRPRSTATVRVIPTDEEMHIARAVREFLSRRPAKSKRSHPQL
jgi:acetate kinase